MRLAKDRNKRNLNQEEIMKKFMERFEVQMMAVAFAEAGEHETARQLLSSRPRRSKRKRPEVETVQRRPRQRMST